MSYTTIRISLQNYKRLRQEAEYKDSMDSVLTRILDSYDRIAPIKSGGSSKK